MPDVTITLKTIDQSTPATKKVKEEFKSLAPGLESAAKGIGSFVSANAMLIGGLAAVGVAVGKSYQEFIKYAGSVRDLAAVSGTGAVEASKLLQVLDDYELTAQDVTAATRFMTKAGLTPTIDTLAKLSDQYNAINDPMAKNEFILQKLGRGGLQWVNVLKQGGDALRDQASEVNKNLILTDEQIEKSEKARLAVDAWGDAWQGFKISIGAAVGGMIAANSEAGEQIDRLKELDSISGKTNQNYRFMTAEQKALTAQMERGAAMTDFYSKQVQSAGEATVAATEDFRGLLSLTMNIADETQDYNEKHSELINQQATLKKEMGALIKQGYTPMSQKVRDLQKDYDELGKDAMQLAAEHGKAMKKMQYDLIVTKLSTDGLTSAEYDLAIAAGEAMGQFDSASANAARAVNKVTDAVVQGKLKAQDLDRALKMMEAYNYNIDVVLEMIAYYSNWDLSGVGGGATPPSGGQTDIPKSKGGDLGNNWTLVGDMPGGVPGPFSELISPGGHVFDAKTSKKIMESGILSGLNSMALAGDLGGGMASSIPRFRPSSTIRSRRPGTGGGTSTAKPELTSGSQAAMFESVQSNISTMQLQNEQQVQTQRTALRLSQQTLTDKLDEVIAVLSQENPRAIGKQVAFELAQAS